ncbi:DUF4258 domain-containing protein [Desulfatibacillum aliphaticivorans]|uniref:DUF4258 domain-containing protein n=1 Tax=Desulfatibacillum aliphaticivorans TaxID=218208 RepID=UPI000A04A553|nr:DUF4258 domain-containing protein [Desulfatibacillum aliphaticivorans]
MTREELTRLIRDASRFGTIFYSDHCFERMDDRNVEIEDVENVIDCGEVLRFEWDPEFENWKAEMTGVDIEGDPLSIQIAINVDGRQATIITCHDERFKK